jgi:cytochrome c oxidase assembly protein subunit 11
MSDEPGKEADRKVNRTMLRKLAAMAVLMFGFGYALVPFYEKICEVTGINNLTQRSAAAETFAKSTQVDLTRTVTVEFDANSRGPWSFKPERNSMQVHPGELVSVKYDITNNEPRAMTGQAIPSYAPMQSAAYFHKVECFCFKQQALPARETREFPVVFVLDPKLPADVHTITLSYTFFEVPGAAASLPAPRLN